MSFCLRPNVCKKCGKPLTMFEGWICLECEKAEQEPKIGRWIAVGDGFWKCSECRCCEISKSNWCPNCGADMRGDADE